jgi:hypothetical protein
VGAPSFAALAKGGIPQRSPYQVLILSLTNPSASTLESKCQGTTLAPRLTRAKQAKPAKSCRKLPQSDLSLRRRPARSCSQKSRIWLSGNKCSGALKDKYGIFYFPSFVNRKKIGVSVGLAVIEKAGAQIAFLLIQAPAPSCELKANSSPFNPETLVRLPCLLYSLQTFPL